MATFAISRPVGKRISREIFYEYMKLILVAFIILFALMTSAQCQQTAEDWFYKGVALDDQGKLDDAIKAYDEAIRLDPQDAESWYNKGVALEALDDRETEANAAFAKAKELGYTG